MSDSDKEESTNRDTLVTILRYLLCIVFPPLAVTNRGCATMLVVLMFTLLGWIPGVIFAFLICRCDKNCPQDLPEEE